MATAALDIAARIGGLADQLVVWRRELHRRPELSFQEHETAAYIAAQLEALEGLTISRPTATSVVADLAGSRPGPTVALRADIDALPLTEENTFAFASERPGVMHACGHDGHTAMLLGVATILTSMRDELPGNVRLVFQHAEELPPGGAQELVAAGVMEGVDMVLGCHLLSTIESGKVAVIPGPAMAAADMFDLTVRGRGGHGAFPHEAVDPVAIAAQVITNLQHVAAREVDPLQSAVVSVTRIAGGTADNIIPMEVNLGGTVRTFSHEMRDHVRSSIERIARGVTEAHGASYSLSYQVGYDAVVNDQALAGVVAAAVEDELGSDGLVDVPPVMGGDDFSAYLGVVPGVYFFVGTRADAADSTFPHHHPRFTLDEGTLPIGVAIFVRSTLALLSP